MITEGLSSAANTRAYRIGLPGRFMSGASLVATLQFPFRVVHVKGFLLCASI